MTTLAASVATAPLDLETPEARADPDLPRFDLLVLGGGPAGVTAALRARELGATVALVERGSLGGTCTNDGCVPTRVLAKAARLIRDAADAGRYGISLGTPSLDFAELLAHTQRTVYRIHEKKQLESHLTGSGVSLFVEAGPAHFTGPHNVELEDGRRLAAKRILVCAGGRPRRLPIPGAEHAITHSDVWGLREIPRSLAIIGGAATGCQLASVFSAFGASVTLLDLAPRLLPQEDRTVSHAVADAFSGHGIEVATGIGGVHRIDRVGDRLLQLTYGRTGEERVLDVELVLLAVGWPGALDGLGLDVAGVDTERGFIRVDDRFRTSAPDVFAAGDITGRMMLVQSATQEARIAAENAVGGEETGGRAFAHRIVPHGGFTDPEYGSVGLTEQQALDNAAAPDARDPDPISVVVPYADLDRAVIDGRTEGACKLIASRTTRLLLGAHVVGEQAVEVVQLVAAGMAAGMTVDALAELELPYPTFTAIVGLAARRLVEVERAGPFAEELPADAVEWERRD